MEPELPYNYSYDCAECKCVTSRVIPKNLFASNYEYNWYCEECLEKHLVCVLCKKKTPENDLVWINKRDNLCRECTTKNADIILLIYNSYENAAERLINFISDEDGIVVPK